jgi:hypothetical protein
MRHPGRIPTKQIDCDGTHYQTARKPERVTQWGCEEPTPTIRVGIATSAARNMMQ